jgi:hypothetical protein
VGESRQPGNVGINMTVFSSFPNISDKFFLSLSASNSTQMQTLKRHLCVFYSMLADGRHPDADNWRGH